MASKKHSLKFTGERLIPKSNYGAAFYFEHLVRYLFSCQFVENKVVLDAACGVGYGSLLLSERGKAATVIGIDISDETIEYATINYKAKNITYKHDDATKLRTIKSGSIDVVVSFETIEHLDNPKNFLKQTKRVLKKKGIFIVSTPNKYVYPPNNPYHTKEYSPLQFKKTLEEFFPNVELLIQNFQFVNIINDTQTNASIIDSKPYSNTTVSIFNNVNQIKNAEYIISICSNQKLSKLMETAIVVNKIDNLDMSMGMISLSKQIKKITEVSKVDFNEYLYLAERDRILTQIMSSKFFKLWQSYCKLRDRALTKK